MFDKLKAHYEENKPLYHIGFVVAAIVVFKAGVYKPGLALAVDPKTLQTLLDEPTGAIVFDTQKIILLNTAGQEGLPSDDS